MSTIEIGDQIRLLDDSTRLTPGLIGTVVEDEFGYEGFFGQPEFTVEFEEDPDTWYIEYKTEGTEWEKVEEEA